MPLWGNNDATAQSAIFAPAQVKLAPNTDNRDALFGNTTGDAFIEGVTVGQYGVDHAEMRATRADHEPRPAHSGWVLRTEGSGGRAGRVQHEVLVAMAGGLSADAENTAFQQYAVVIDTHPSDATADAANGDLATFDALGHAVPSQAVTYKWQKYYTANTTWANVNNGAIYSNTTTVELTVVSNAVVNGELYRCGVFSTGADTRYTNQATFHVLPDIEFLVQPDDAQGDASNDDIVTFTTEANAASEAITYQWQFANTEDGFEDLTDAGAYSNTATAELSVLANTASNGEIYRCEVTVDDTLLVSYSSNATLTVVA